MAPPEKVKTKGCPGHLSRVEASSPLPQGPGHGPEVSSVSLQNRTITHLKLQLGEYPQKQHFSKPKLPSACIKHSNFYFLSCPFFFFFNACLNLQNCFYNPRVNCTCSLETLPWKGICLPFSSPTSRKEHRNEGACVLVKVSGGQAKLGRGSCWRAPLRPIGCACRPGSGYSGA